MSYYDSMNNNCNSIIYYVRLVRKLTKENNMKMIKPMI